VGLILAVYFYTQSIRERHLVYVVHPAKAIVVKSGQTSRLSVAIDGKTASPSSVTSPPHRWPSGKTAKSPHPA
jgi:hypothetical protein